MDLPRLAAGKEHFCIAGPLPGKQLFLRLLRAFGSRIRHQSPVLYVHGATFPSALSVASRFDVGALDFYGFGHSDRYSQMDEPAEAHAPLELAAAAEKQLAAAVQFICEREQASRLTFLRGNNAGATMATHDGTIASVPGYNLGSKELARSPISLEDWERMKQSALFTDEDVICACRTRS